MDGAFIPRNICRSLLGASDLPSGMERGVMLEEVMEQAVMVEEAMEQVSAVCERV